MKTIIISLFVCCLICISCEKNQENGIKSYDVQGFAQKGPFNTGTNITLLELNSSLQPTGLTFYSTVHDKTGSFSIPNVELSSRFVELMADGYYFNESWGKVTSARLVLKSLADIKESSSININLLTHISAERIKYLMQNEEMAYENARIQAQNEILRIFSFEEVINEDYSHLNLAQSGKLNSQLLAISCIIQGIKDVARLSEFITEIALDLKTDGVLDSEEIMSELATSAVLCNYGGIRKNLTDFYDTDSIFDDFQYHVQHFIAHTENNSMIHFNFPEETEYGINLLSVPDDALLDITKTYCITPDYNATGITRFGMGITTLKLSGTGTVEYTPHQVPGWIYEEEYCSNEEEYGFSCGIYINNWSATSVSKTPVSLKFTGSGLMKITFHVESENLPDNGGYYRIQKFVRW